MTTDQRELLELAAYAIGEHLSWMTNYKAAFIGDDIWNPLEDKADAFDLMVKLRLDVESEDSYFEVYQRTPEAVMASVPHDANLYQYARAIEAAVLEAQGKHEPVGYQFQSRDGEWCPFIDDRHYEATVKDGTWPIRAIYAAPVVPPGMALFMSRVADLMHLMCFATIHTPTESDGPQIKKAIKDIKEMIAAAEGTK